MSLKLNESLARQVVAAHRIVETVILRGRQGEVFTIEIGTPLSPKTGPAFGAKVAQVSPVQQHLGVCWGATIEEVFELAQRYVAEALSPPVQVSRRAA